VLSYRPGAYDFMCTKKEETDSIFNKEDKQINEQTNKQQEKKQWMIFERP
jgi:hypothetical protein